MVFVLSPKNMLCTIGHPTFSAWDSHSLNLVVLKNILSSNFSYDTCSSLVRFDFTCHNLFSSFQYVTLLPPPRAMHCVMLIHFLLLIVIFFFHHRIIVSLVSVSCPTAAKPGVHDLHYVLSALIEDHEVIV